MNAYNFRESDLSKLQLDGIDGIEDEKEQQRVWEALLALRDEDGRILTEYVVRAASKKSSPLHRYVVTCDESEAAAHYYAGNARKLMRSVHYTRIVRGKRERVHAFQNVTIPRSDVEEGADQHYRLTEEVRRRVDCTESVCRREISRVLTACSNAREVGGFDRWPAWREIEQLANTLSAAVNGQGDDADAA